MLIALLVVFCHCHHKSRQTGNYIKWNTELNIVRSELLHMTNNDT
uniref:Uncharacterized protein n=1 Tax=Anguilla anguilla TaxID=7936 RepID=A0A0E9U7H9_ANGAN